MCECDLRTEMSEQKTKRHNLSQSSKRVAEWGERDCTCRDNHTLDIAPLQFILNQQYVYWTLIVTLVPEVSLHCTVKRIPEVPRRERELLSCAPGIPTLTRAATRCLDCAPRGAARARSSRRPRYARGTRRRRSCAAPTRRQGRHRGCAPTWGDIGEM